MGMRLLTLFFMLLLAAPAGATIAVAHFIVRDSPLAGFRYNDGKRVWDEMREGDPLRLVREPDNPFDANAIRVEWSGRKIGYVPQQENSALARELDAGAAIDARIVKLAKSRNGRYLISYDILVPLRNSHRPHEETK
jgi:hypothetical protein